MRIALFDQAGRAAPASDALFRDRFSKGLTARGHDVELFVATARPDCQSVGRGPRWPDAYVSLERIRRSQSKSPFDAIHIVNCDGYSLAKLACESFSDLPVVISFRGPSVDLNLCFLWRGWKMLGARASFVVPSYQLRGRLATVLGNAKSQIVVVPNGIPRPFPSLIPAYTLRQHLRISSDEKLWVIPGLVRREDRVLEMLDALVAHVESKRIVVTIAGAAVNEDRRERLNAFVSSRKLSFRVIVLGGLNRETILSLAASSDLCLFPPGDEDGRSSLLEAALLGVPTIAASSPSHQQLGNLPWVVLLNQPDGNALIEAGIAASAQLRHGNPNSTTQLYTVDQEIDAILALYQAKPHRTVARSMSLRSGWSFTEKDPSSRKRRPLKIMSRHATKLLVLARGCGQIARDVRWAEEAVEESGRKEVDLRIIIGTDASADIEIGNIVGREVPVIPVPDRWLSLPQREVIVLAEMLVSKRECSLIAGYGLSKSGVIATLTGSRYDLMSAVVLDPFDQSDLRIEVAPGDHLALTLASAVLTYDCEIPFRLNSFKKVYNCRPSIYLSHKYVDSYGFLVNLLSSLPAPPFVRESVPCTSTL